MGAKAVAVPAYCIPAPLDPKGFNPKASLPFGVKTEHVKQAMQEFLDFVEFIDTQLCTKGMIRFEEMLMPANFSSMVGEFMNATIPKYCKTIVKNQYHNGHPDMIPAGKYAGDSVQHAGCDGIECKGSRYSSAWQGHNAEDCWLMVFVFEGARPVDASKGIAPVQFKFKEVLCGQLSKSDWQFSGRKGESRRTITASVKPSGYAKMAANWIYRAT